MSVYNYQNQFWTAVKIPKGMHHIINNLLNELFAISMGILPKNYSDIKEAKQEKLSLLKLIEQKYGIENYEQTLENQPQETDLRSGLEIIVGKIQIPGTVVGISGAPGTGKTTLATNLKIEDIKIIDEFSSEGRDYKGSKKTYKQLSRIVQKRKEQGKSTLVIGTTIYHEEVDYLVHILPSSELRRQNLEKRQQTQDRFRIRYFELFETIDFFRYGIQRVKADLIIKPKL